MSQDLDAAYTVLRLNAAFDDLEVLCRQVKADRDEAIRLLLRNFAWHPDVQEFLSRFAKSEVH